MARAEDFPPPFRKFIEPYYVEPFGDVPPVPGERLKGAGDLGRDYNVLMEEMRARALFSDILDKKTAQLIAFALLSRHGSPGLYWHAKAARRYGASWDELAKVLEIAAFFNGFSALQDGARAIAKLWQEEAAERGAR